MVIQFYIVHGTETFSKYRVTILNNITFDLSLAGAQILIAFLNQYISDRFSEFQCSDNFSEFQKSTNLEGHNKFAVLFPGKVNIPKFTFTEGFSNFKVSQ